MANELIVRNGLIVLGNNTVTNNEIISGNLTVLGAANLTASWAITASYAYFAETSSYSKQAASASYISPENVTNILSGSGVVSSSAQVIANISGQQISPAGVTSSLQGTASYAITSNTALTAISSSYANNASTADSATSSSYAQNATTADSSTSASFAQMALTASYVLGLNGHTASWALNSISSSYAQNASTSDTSVSASYAQNASTADSATSASFATTASFATKASTADVATTASYVAWANVDESNTDVFAGTASYATKAGTSLTATSASYAQNASTADSATTAATASYVAWTNVDGKPALISSSLQFTSSDVFNVGTITASNIQVENLSVINVTSSVVYSSGSNVFGSTLSNTQKFTGSVQITGSLTVDGPITGTISTASYALFAVTSSHAISSSYVKGGVEATTPLKITNAGGITTTISTFETTGVTSDISINELADTDAYAAKWLVSSRDGANLRTSEIFASWDATGNVVAFTEFSTIDVGDTSPLSFTVEINLNQVQLMAHPVSGNWSIRGTRILV